MNIIRAKQILTSLAGGIDPFTGEVLYEDNICNHGKTIEAINCVLEELERFEGKNSGIKPEHAWRNWTAGKDALLKKLFISIAPKQEFMRSLERSESGIAARLVRLGMINSMDEFRRRR